MTDDEVFEVVIEARSVDGERRWARTGTAPLGSLELLRAAATAGAIAYSDWSEALMTSRVLLRRPGSAEGAVLYSAGEAMAYWKGRGGA